MAKIISDVSRTFSEYLLVPRLTEKQHTPDAVSLKIPVSRYKKGETPKLSLNIPFTAASMQSVSGENMAVALAKRGGAAFVYCSQSIEAQAEMVRNVKKLQSGICSK